MDGVIAVRGPACAEGVASPVTLAGKARASTAADLCHARLIHSTTQTRPSPLAKSIQSILDLDLALQSDASFRPTLTWPKQMAAPPPLPVSIINGAIGPYFVGCFIGLWLSGFIWSQGLRYFRLFPRDRMAFKLVV